MFYGLTFWKRLRTALRGGQPCSCGRKLLWDGRVPMEGWEWELAVLGCAGESESWQQRQFFGGFWGWQTVSVLLFYTPGALWKTWRDVLLPWRVEFSIAREASFLAQLSILWPQKLNPNSCADLLHFYVDFNSSVSWVNCCLTSEWQWDWVFLGFGVWGGEMKLK